MYGVRRGGARGPGRTRLQQLQQAFCYSNYSALQRVTAAGTYGLEALLVTALQPLQRYSTYSSYSRDARAQERCILSQSRLVQLVLAKPLRLGPKTQGPARPPPLVQPLQFGSRSQALLQDEHDNHGAAEEQQQIDAQHGARPLLVLVGLVELLHCKTDAVRGLLDVVINAVENGALRPPRQPKPHVWPNGGGFCQVPGPDRLQGHGSP